MWLTFLFEDFTQRWIVNDNWTYTADVSSFLSSSAQSSAEKTLLVFVSIFPVSLKTASSHSSYLSVRHRHHCQRRQFRLVIHGVYKSEIHEHCFFQSLAGHPVAWVANQFRNYVFDVSEALASPVQSNANLTIALESAWYYGLNTTSRNDTEALFVDDFEYPEVRVWIRKAQSDFGWDWVRRIFLELFLLLVYYNFL